MKKILLILLVTVVSSSLRFLSAQTVEGGDYNLVKERFESYAKATAGRLQWLSLFPAHLPDIFSEDMSTGNIETLRIKAGLKEDMLLTEIMGQEWFFEWVNYFDDIYTYDGNNFVVEIMSYYWESGEWINDTWQTITNNEMGQAEEVLLYVWNADSTLWDLTARMSLTYNAQGDIQEMLMEFWMDPIWVGFMKMSYYYNTNGISEIVTQGYDYLEGVWINSTRDLFSYNSSGYPVEELSQVWEEEEWKDNEMETMLYNGQWQHVESIVQQWLDDAWENYLHFTYTYNEEGDLVLEIEQHWAPGEWIDAYKYQYSYINNSYVSEIIEQRWNGNEWENSFRETYYYNPVSLPEALLKEEGISVLSYPNPFQDALTLRYHIGSPAVVSITVYDLSGKIIDRIIPDTFKAAGSYQVNWMPEPELDPGVYLIQLNSGGFTYVSRVIRMN